MVSERLGGGFLAGRLWLALGQEGRGCQAEGYVGEGFDWGLFQ